MKILEKIKDLLIPRSIKRVYKSNDLHSYHVDGHFWNVTYHSDPEIIKKIHLALSTAYELRILVSSICISYTAWTKKYGIVKGSCHRCNYDFFEFGIAKSGHRYDIYNEDKDHPDIAAFYDWWKSVVYKYEKEFDKDYNL